MAEKFLQLKANAWDKHMAKNKTRTICTCLRLKFVI